MSCQVQEEQATKRVRVEISEMDSTSLVDPEAEITISFKMWAELTNLVNSLKREVKLLQTKLITVEALHRDKNLVREWQSPPIEKSPMSQKAVQISDAPIELNSAKAPKTPILTTQAVPLRSPLPEKKLFVDLLRSPHPHLMSDAPQSSEGPEKFFGEGSEGPEKFQTVTSKRQQKLSRQASQSSSQPPQVSFTSMNPPDLSMKNGGETLKQSRRQTLRNQVRSSVDPGEVLNTLLNNSSADPHQVQMISSLCIAAPLSSSAKRDPIFAFKNVFKALTQLEPLDVSIISATQAEIFLTPENRDLALHRLSSSAHLTEMPLLSEKDLRRRAASYNRGYFLPLRRASLAGFPTVLQLRVLEIAESSIPNLPKGRQEEVRNAIRKDRVWLTAGDQV
mmetsp:Transcript_18566/g.26701  ORF Transcript_18566/g.26701 Transcript_18566/m.26701 type:complete len:393 (-) Transcript_18566:744-1922(-)